MNDLVVPEFSAPPTDLANHALLPKQGRPGQLEPVVDMAVFNNRRALRHRRAWLGMLGGITTAGGSILLWTAPNVNMVGLILGITFFWLGLGAVGLSGQVMGHLYDEEKWLQEAAVNRFTIWAKKYWYLKVNPEAINGKAAITLLHNPKPIHLTFQDENGRFFTAVGGNSPHKLLDYAGNPLSSRAMDAAEKLNPPPVIKPTNTASVKETVSERAAIASLNKVGRDTFQQADQLHARLLALPGLSINQQHEVTRAGDIIRDCKHLLARLANVQQAKEEEALDNIMHALNGAIKTLRQVEQKSIAQLVKETRVLARYVDNLTETENDNLRLA